MNELDFSGKGVLVVGGSSGIGNGIAHAFLERGAAVHVWGTRASAQDYDGVEGSDLNGLAYSQVDVAHRDQIATASGPPALDVLILCQGTVVYRRGEFEPEGWDQVMSVNLDSLLACAMRFHDGLAAGDGRFGRSRLAGRAGAGGPGGGEHGRALPPSGAGAGRSVRHRRHGLYGPNGRGAFHPRQHRPLS